MNFYYSYYIISEKFNRNISDFLIEIKINILIILTIIFLLFNINIKLKKENI